MNHNNYIIQMHIYPNVNIYTYKKIFNNISTTKKIKNLISVIRLYRFYISVAKHNTIF